MEFYRSRLINCREYSPGWKLQEFKEYMVNLLSEETAERRRKIVEALCKDKELLKVHRDLGNWLKDYKTEVSTFLYV